MIASLSGNLREKRPDLAVIDVQGVGYAVQIPLSTFYLLGEIDSRVHLKIHMHVREDALALFGFLTDKERLMFEKLIGISGIGPKLAINILSGAAVDDLAVFLKAGDITRLIRIPGIGKKTAERMVLELRDKVKDLALDPATAAVSSSSQLKEDVLSALINLGYQRASAERVLDKVIETTAADSSTFENLLRTVLRRMSGAV